jgi:hypothetical protein
MHKRGWNEQRKDSSFRRRMREGFLGADACAFLLVSQREFSFIFSHQSYMKTMLISLFILSCFHIIFPPIWNKLICYILLVYLLYLLCSCEVYFRYLSFILRNNLCLLNIQSYGLCMFDLIVMHGFSIFVFHIPLSTHPIINLCLVTSLITFDPWICQENPIGLLRGGVNQ